MYGIYLYKLSFRHHGERLDRGKKAFGRILLTGYNYMIKDVSFLDCGLSEGGKIMPFQVVLLSAEEVATLELFKLCTKF
jgi:hypothetical protein